MTPSTRTNLLSGCLLYALATLPLTALAVTGAVWLQRLGVWASLWSDSVNILCCLTPCVAMALPLGLMLYNMSLRRGTIGHILVQMTDHRGVGLLDICILVGVVTVTLVSLFLLPPSNLVVYLPAGITLVAIAGRWALRNLTAIVPFDEAGQNADLAALGQLGNLTAGDIRDYNLPPRSLRITAANAAGPLGQLQSGSWRLEFQGAALQATKDPAWLALRLAGLVTNLNGEAASLEALPKLTVRDAQGRETSPRQVATLPVQPETGLVTALAPGASARLTVTFDVAATERVFDLIARSRELAPGEEIIVPF
jgi:hypothetical protein